MTAGVIVITTQINRDLVGAFREIDTELDVFICSIGDAGDFVFLASLFFGFCNQ